MFTKTPALLAAMLAVAPLSAHAHMIMANPVPFNSPNNSPLAPDGSDFPCKGPPSGSAQVNEWKAGSQQSLSFTGTAVHGGGSCQISVTNDKNPTKDSKWKVIHSIEGGCPAAVEGNLDEKGPSSQGTFPFTVPQDLPNGDLTVAWTWFNKVGNREMYMNCGAVSVTGGKDDASGLDALPDMAVANVNVPGSCGTTKEGNDYTFEKAGDAVTKAGKGPFVYLCSGSASQPGAGGGSGGGDSGSGSGAGNGAPVSQPPPAAPAPAVPSTLRTVVTVTAPMPPYPTNNGSATPAPSGTGAGTPPVPKPTAAQPTAAPVSPQPPAAPAPGPAAGGSSCASDGQIICSPDGTLFGICNFGKAVMMPVAGGTKCVNGAIAKRGDYSHRNQRTAI